MAGRNRCAPIVGPVRHTRKLPVRRTAGSLQAALRSRAAGRLSGPGLHPPEIAIPVFKQIG